MCFSFFMPLPPYKLGVHDVSSAVIFTVDGCPRSLHSFLYSFLYFFFNIVYENEYKLERELKVVLSVVRVSFG